jgi:hypothetical protein
MARVSVSQMLSALVDLGRTYLDRPAEGDRVDGLVAQCHDLVSAHGEASGTALASRIVDGYLSLDGTRNSVSSCGSTRRSPLMGRRCPPLRAIMSMPPAKTPTGRSRPQ